jgi:hypothetical protein
MGYVIAAILVVLIVAGFIVALTARATRQSNMSSIVGSDSETPLGDTSQHSETVHEPVEVGVPKDSSKVARPVVGGEGEGERFAR